MPRDKNGHFYFPHYPTIWIADTAHLTLAEEGAYLRLRDHYMISRQPLPDNDRAIARFCGISVEEFMTVKAALFGPDRYFKPEKINGSDVWVHNFCERELSESGERIENAREWGKLAHKKKPEGMPGATPEAPSRVASANRSDQIKSNKTNKRSDHSSMDFRLSASALEEVRGMAPGWDKYALEAKFRAFVRGKKTPRHPDKAFLGWVRKFTKGKPP